MAAGRPQKPTEILKLNGGYREDRHANRGDSTSVALPKDTILEAPKKYSAATKKAWDCIVPSLILQGILAAEDLPTLDVLFNAYEEYEKAKKAIAKFDKAHPDLITSDDIADRKKLHAWLSQASNDFHKISARFGITPTERVRIANPQKETKKEDPLEVILAG